MEPSGARDAPSGARSRRHVPFVLHELAEYVVAVALVVVGVHVSGSAEVLLVAVGVAMLLLGALTAGRLGAYHLLSRRAHHAGDLVLVVALALSPVVAHRSLHVAGIVLAEVVALLLLRIERRTEYVAPAARARAMAGARPGPGGGAGGASSQPDGGGTDAAARLGAAAGASAASALSAAASLAPAAGRAARVGARGLGVVAGMTRRAARDRAAARRTAGRG